MNHKMFESSLAGKFYSRQIPGLQNDFWIITNPSKNHWSHKIKRLENSHSTSDEMSALPCLWYA